MTGDKTTRLTIQCAMLVLSAELRSIADGLELDACRYGDNYAELNEGALSALDRLEYEHAQFNELVEGMNERSIEHGRLQH